MCDRRDAVAVMLFNLSIRDSTEETQVVLLYSFRFAAFSKLAHVTMSGQSELLVSRTVS